MKFWYCLTPYSCCNFHLTEDVFRTVSEVCSHTCLGVWTCTYSHTYRRSALNWHSAPMVWRLKCKHRKDRPAETDMHKQHTRCTYKWSHTAWCSETRMWRRLTWKLFKHCYFNYRAESEKHAGVSAWVFILGSAALPCLFLPPEGSLGKAAECPAFLRGAENSRPGAALHSIHCLQGQRQSSGCHNIFHTHFSLRIYQDSFRRTI